MKYLKRLIIFVLVAYASINFLVMCAMGMGHRGNPTGADIALVIFWMAHFVGLAMFSFVFREKAKKIVEWFKEKEDTP